MWESVELRHLRTFLVVADELHFGRAADRLRASPSRASQLIRTLETIVGEPLFVRTSRHVALTSAGAQLRTRVLPAYAELQRAVDELRGGVVGELRLGLLMATSGGRRLTEIVALFERRHPGSGVAIRDADWRDPLGRLQRGEVDLMALRFPLHRRDLTVGPVLTVDDRALAVAVYPPLAGRESGAVEDLAGYTIAYNPALPREILDAFLPSVTPSGAPIPWREVTDPVQLMTLVARGEIVHCTVTSMPDFFSYPGVTYLPISDLPPSPAGLVWRTGAETAAVRAFVAAAVDVLGSSLR